MKFLENPTRNLFFTGKGGVGKTSVACATAVRLADAGKRVLLVSTDPASNLGEVLHVELGHLPKSVPRVPGLTAMNLDPEQSAADYRERMVGPYRGVLPDVAVASMEEQFSGSCTLEIAAFDEFSKLLGDPDATQQFDHVIFDTAPTGHTLRLLTLPSAWTGFMETNTTGTSCLGPLAGLQTQQKLYQSTVKALSDPATTTLVLVTRPEKSAFKEANRTSSELADLGVTNQHLVVNGIFQAVSQEDPLANAMQLRSDNAISEMPERLVMLPRTLVPLLTHSVLGLPALRMLGNAEEVEVDESPTKPETGDSEDKVLADSSLTSLGAMVDDLATTGHGVILAMGKGGVGKTTVAAAIATALAEQGLPVHLSTTDPAAHIAATVLRDHLPNMTVDRIDPLAETASYSQEVLANAGKDLDEAGRALLEEDLRSPCTEEIAVFRAFANAVAQGKDRFVVLDTAPTGHTILLLDSALAYHREVLRQTSQMPESVQQLLPRLRDPEFTRVLIVTLPEATPVHEAAQLQDDLRRAEITPYGWVINQSLTPLEVTDPCLRARRQHEVPYINEVVQQHATRTAIIPWQVEPPTGRDGLKHLAATAISE